MDQYNAEFLKKQIYDINFYSYDKDKIKKINNIILRIRDIIIHENNNTNIKENIEIFNYYFINACYIIDLLYCYNRRLKCYLESIGKVKKNIFDVEYFRARFDKSFLLDLVNEMNKYYNEVYKINYKLFCTNIGTVPQTIIQIVNNIISEIINYINTYYDL